MRERHPDQPKLELRNVSKRYGDVAALKETSLSVSAGEFVTLLGPSGSGKTTLLTMIAGMTATDTGEIWIDGHDATHQPVHRRDIGMVFQNYALFPHLTVFENIAFPLRMRRVPEAEIRRRVGEMLEVVHLPDVGDRLPRELSGGQQQRIALARCTVYRPSIVLMDEPLGALDKNLRDQMQLEIKRLHADLGITVMFVTHDQDEAMAMSDRICLMNEGRIEQMGAPDELYHRPQSVFAANFLGNSNILPATVLDRNDRCFHLSGPNGASLRAPAEAGSGILTGRGVGCMVRPEHIAILPAGAKADNMVEVTVEQRLMVGAITRYYCRLADGSPVSVWQLTSRMEEQPGLGAVVRLGWSTSHTVLLPAAGDER